MEKEAASLKTKKILQRLNPTALNQREYNGKRSCKSKNKKKSYKPWTRQAQTKGNKMVKEAASLKTEKILESLNPTALNQRQ